MPFQSWINPWTKPISDDGYRFSPLHLGPYAFYDANLGGSSTGITDSSAYARADMTVGAGSNSPLWLPYTTPSVYQPDNAGNSVSAPWNAAFDMSAGGTVEVVLAEDWVATGTWYQLAGTQHFLFRVFTDGTLLWQAYAGSSSWDNVFSSVAIPAGSRYLKVVATPSTTTFYTAPASGAYSQLGSVQPGYSAVPLPIDLFIGSNSGTSLACPFAIRSALIKNSAGDTVATFDAALCAQTGYTDSLGNVWAVGRATAGRKTVVQSPAANSANSLFLLGTDDWLDVPAAAIPPMTASDAFTWVAVARLWNTLPTNTDVVSKHQGYSGNLFPGVGLGMRSANNAGIRLKDGTNGNAPEATGVTSGIRQVIAGVVPASGTVVSYRNSSTASTARTVGDMTNAVNAYVGRNDSGVYIDMEFRSLLTFNRALSATEIAQLVAYYGGGL